jgi:3-deoxy-D-manno-octulosonic-acid transferase
MIRYNIPQADIWIQAASAGESYLASAVLKKLKPSYPVNVLLTTNTSQGMEINEKTARNIASLNREMSIYAAYFPFDSPSIMKTAVQKINPKLMVLLETEIWPGHLAALKQHRCKILIINGRLKQKSLDKYLIWPSFWKRYAPDRILAMSENDASRFKMLFGNERVGIMPNIKFDRFESEYFINTNENPLKNIFPENTSFLVLGSVRQEEEPFIEKIINDVLSRQPDMIIGLFPRHMHRIKHWQETLVHLPFPWKLRSETKHTISPGTVVLWDTFGELTQAYILAKAVFVGGSLAPLGGQNFLEPLMYGVVPVIGPSWENFAWVGKEIIYKNLLQIGADWKEVSDMLIKNLISNPPRETISESALSYVRERKGGTEQACDLIHDFL